MKQYQKPILLVEEIKLDNIILISTNDGAFNANENGVYDEIWK